MLLNSRQFKFLKNYRNVNVKSSAKREYRVENVFLKGDRALSELINLLISNKKEYSTISLKLEVLILFSAKFTYVGARNATTIRSRAPGALILASEASCARWECASEASRFFNKTFTFSLFYLKLFTFNSISNTKFFFDNSILYCTWPIFYFTNLITFN